MKQYLTFNIDQNTYGVQVLDIQEIRTFEQPTNIITNNPAMLGVMNLRGDIVPRFINEKITQFRNIS